MLPDTDDDHYNPTVRVVEFKRNGQNCGFHLTRSKWDPYPWVSSVEENSIAKHAGINPGDCVLEVNGDDIVGKRISEVAEVVKSKSEQVSLLLWNAGIDTQCSPETICCGPIPTNLQRLSACLSTILAFLECPVCLDTISPPTYQCDNGHLICMRCRTKSERCPVCRLRFNRGRSILSDQVYTAIIDAFNMREEPEKARSQKIQQIFKPKKLQKNVPDIKITHAYTNKKLLSKFAAKSSSVDNLSNSKCLSPLMTSKVQIDINTNLKARSLSNNEIFISESPCVSRSGSTNKLDLETEHRPASYHGSCVSLNDNLEFRDNSGSLERNFLDYFCPFSSKCTSKLKDHVLEHFQNQHSSNPLIQYFTTSITIDVKKLEDEEICYFIQLGSNKFFLKAVRVFQKNEHRKDLLIWMWNMGPETSSKEFELLVEIKDCNDKLLMKLQSKIYSLNQTSYQEIVECHKGIYFSTGALTAFGNTSRFLFDITRKNC